MTEKPPVQQPVAAAPALRTDAPGPFAAPPEGGPGVLRDMAARPGWYLRDLWRCAALHFSMGNVVYSLFIGAVAGLVTGPAAAFAVQGAVTAYTAARQIAATHKGRDFGAPFRVQAFANWGTAGIFLATGLASGPGVLAMMVMPVLTLSLWGRAHWDIANMLARVEALKKAGADDAALADDPLVKKYTNRYMMAGGGADIAALFKDKTIQEVAAVFADPFTRAHMTALAALPFFAVGVWMTFMKRTPVIGPAAQACAHAVIDRMPGRLRALFNLRSQDVTPNHLYAAGYGLSALLSAGQPLFALSLAFWGMGYNRLTIEDKIPPVSAADYEALRKKEAALPVPAAP